MTRGLLACCCLIVGCGGGASDVQVTWKIEPGQPVVGQRTAVRLLLHTSGGSPVSGARLRLEAHMSHPGMAPVTADLTERGPGEYGAHLELSMAGDWVFVMTGALENGRRITDDTRVLAVHPAG